MSTAETISFAVELAGPGLPNQAEVAAAAFLARYSGRTLEAYRFTEGPILRRASGERLDRRTPHRWVRSIGRRAGLGHVHLHMLRSAFIMAALDASVPLRDVQLAARHADPRTTTVYDHRRRGLDHHAVRFVVEHCGLVYVHPAPPGSAVSDPRLVFLGDDEAGRAIEVIGVEMETEANSEDHLRVILAMALREKYRRQYEEAKRWRV